jgi:thymidylate synthase
MSMSKEAFCEFETEYMHIVRDVLEYGDYRQTRNVATKALCGKSLTFTLEDTDKFPIIMGRQMYHKGVLGELAAMLRQPKHIDDFTKWGCNFWNKWAKPDGSIEVDYGNAWFANGQMDHLRTSLLSNPTDRRMLISGWRPERLAELDLPCCHYSYQFFVRSSGYLDMVWTQRSVDVMVGLPSDIVFAAAWLISIASWAGLKPGKVKMDFGDTHIYENHFEQASEYINSYLELVEAVDVSGADFEDCYPRFEYLGNGKDFLEFEPDDLVIEKYIGASKLELELNA